MANAGMQPERSKPSKPAAKPAARALAKPMAKFVAKPAAKLVAKANKKPTPKPVAKAVKKPASKPVAKGVKQPAAKTAVKPVKQGATKAAAKVAKKPAPKPRKLRGLEGDPASGTMSATLAWNASSVTITFPASDLYSDNMSQIWTWNGAQLAQGATATSGSFNSSLATGNTLYVRQIRNSNPGGVGFTATGINRGTANAVLR